MTTIEQLKADYYEASDNFNEALERGDQEEIALARRESQDAYTAWQRAIRDEMQAGFRRLRQLKAERGIA